MKGHIATYISAKNWQSLQRGFSARAELLVTHGDVVAEWLSAGLLPDQDVTRSNFKQTWTLQANAVMSS